MKRTKELSILIIFCLLLNLMFPMCINKAYAVEENKVTLNFEGATIEEKSAKYDGLGYILLLKDNEAIDITNYMKIDLNEANYELQVIGEIQIVDPGQAIQTKRKVLNINGWRYGLKDNQGTIGFLEKKLSGTLNIKLEEILGTIVNTKVENVYDRITSTGTIDLTKEYTIDLSKEDEITLGLKTFVNQKEIIYYKNDNGGLIETENENEAIIKIVNNQEENKAVMSAINIGNKKEEQVKGLHTKYTGSKLTYTGTDPNDEQLFGEIRTDYYTMCTYNFTFKYANEPTEPKEYKFIEGANQTYIKGIDKNAKFRIDADYNLFNNEVYVDNNLISTNNYESKSGSTIITLKDDYLQTLEVGEHTLKVAFSNQKEVTTKFEIKEQQNTNIEEQQENENETKQESVENTTNPKTGDNIIVYAVLLGIAVIGTVATIIINNRKNKK